RLPTLRLLSRRTPARVGRAGRQARPDFVISLKSGGWWWVSPTLRLLRLLRSLANFPKKDTMRSRVLRSGYVHVKIDRIRLHRVRKTDIAAGWDCGVRWSK